MMKLMTDGDGQASASGSGRNHPLTTLHLARAAAGDAESLEWLVARLSPILYEHASFRLGNVLRRHFDPEDLVHDAWVAALPKLPTLVEDPTRRRTPVLLKYLSSTVVMRIRALARRHANRLPRETANAGPEQLSAEQSGAITRVARDERRSQLKTALAELPERDREIVLLRGIEQLPSTTAATMLGVGVEAVKKRYQRALVRLRERLPESVFDELVDG